MNHQPPIFNSGLELASSVVDSQLLNQSWSFIWSLYAEVNPNTHQQAASSSSFSPIFKIFKQPDLTVIAFLTSPIYTPRHLQQQGAQDLVTSATLKGQNFPHLDFLCSRGNPSFSIHSAAVSGFALLFPILQASPNQFLVPRDGEIVLESPLIVTGHGLGGSIASLFTLWLMDCMSQLPSKKPSKKLPLCITFGSPLIGDSGLHRSISQRSTWKSCFLHVVSSLDYLPRLLAASKYKPFGTFMLCSELGSACVEDPDVVSILFRTGIELASAAAHLVSGEGLPVQHYGLMVEHLKLRDVCKGSSELVWPVADSLQAGIVLLLEAIGIAGNQQQEHPNITNLASQLYQKERLSTLSKRNAMDPSRKLNDIKIKMAFLEWYKKDSKNKGLGYYDSYKNQRGTSDMDIAKHKKFLTNYWKEMVEEAEDHPQKEGAFVRMTWLYAGNTYRKMVEPLDIAEYYRKNRDYVKQGRSKHYVLLEKWWKEDCESHHPIDLLSKKRNVDGNFTEDSCFWAHVEEARISCGLVKDFGTFRGGGGVGEEEKRLCEGYLVWFEGYVMEQIGNYAVNPEIFVGESSFMKWWAEFQRIVGIGHSSALMEFMRKGMYRKYGSQF